MRLSCLSLQLIQYKSNEVSYEGKLVPFQCSRAHRHGQTKWTESAEMLTYDFQKTFSRLFIAFSKKKKKKF